MVLSLPGRLKLYVAGVVAAAILVLAPLVSHLDFSDRRGLFLWLLLLGAAEFFPVASPRGGAAVTGASTISFAAVLVFGPGLGAICGATGALLTNAVRRRVGLMRIVFNMGQLSLSLAAAGLVYRGLGGHPVPNLQNSLYHPGVEDILPVLGCHFAFFLLNTGQVATAVGLSERTSPLTCWRANYLWALPQSLGVPAVSFLLALFYLRVGVAPVVALFVWTMIFTRSFRVVMELRDSHRRTLAMLASATDAGVPYLNRRSQSVADVGTRIAREMGLSHRRRELVEYAGLLHNVGLLGIDRRILQKPGPLAAAEWAQVKTHVEKGAGIVDKVPALRRVAEVVLAHHERPDGSGYPRGLAGDQVPLEACIIRVAEAFVAMTNESPYQSRLDPETAVARLREGSGGAFDEAVVEVLAKLAERGEVSGNGS